MTKKLAIRVIFGVKQIYAFGVYKPFVQTDLLIKIHIFESEKKHTRYHLPRNTWKYLTHTHTHTH